MMPTYSYICDFCKSEFDSFRKVDNRKDPESEPCPFCNEIGGVKQLMTPVTVSLSTGMSSMVRKSLKGSAFEEKLNAIHKNTPGSTLNNSSTLVDVK